VLNHYDTFFVLGKRGRFGLAFSALLRDISLEVFEFSSAELDDALRGLNLKLKDGARVCIIWCLGSGNSALVSSQNRELHLLRKLYAGLEAEKTPLTNSVLVYLSTGGKMYGLNAGRVNESSKVSPIAIYGQQKRECERLVEKSTPLYFKSSVICRIANAYSMRESIEEPKGFVESCLWALQTGRQLNLTAGPLSRKQYGSHIDYSKVILESLKIISTKSQHRIFNIAPNFTYNLYEIINIFQTHFGEKLKLNELEQHNHVEDTLILESEVEEFFRIKYEWSRIETNLQLLRIKS